MNKKLTIALTGALALGMAAPALADTTFSGFLYLSPTLETPFGSTDDTETFTVDQRFRFKMINTPSDLVKMTWYAEADNVWGAKEGRLTNVYDADGDKIGTTKQGGSGWAADSVNVETKNMFVTIDVPDSPLNMSLGVQRTGDTALFGTFNSQDVAAAKFNYDMVTAGIIFPGNEEEIYFAQVGYKADAFGINADLYYDDVQNGDDTTTFGAKVTTSVADINLAAGLGMQDGDSAAGFMGALEADATFGPAGIDFLFAYFQDDEDGEGWQMLPAQDGPFANYNLNIFLGSAAFNTNAGDKVWKNVSTDGLMITALMASFQAGDYNVALSGGYFQAVDDHTYGESEVGSEFGLLVKRAFLDGKVITALMANVATFGDGYAGADADLEDAHRVAISIITPF